MQGDYMILRYNGEVFPERETILSLPARGTIILALDQDGVGRYARRGTGVDPGEQELRLRLKEAAGDEPQSSRVRRIESDLANLGQLAQQTGEPNLADEAGPANQENVFAGQHGISR